MKLNSLSSLLFGTVRRQLIVGVMLVHAVMMTLFVWDLTHRQQAMLLEQQVGQATALSQSVATSASVWLVARDVAGLQEIVEAQKRYPELLYAMVIDQDGVVLAHTDSDRRGLYVKDLPEKAQFEILQRTAALVDVVSPAMVAGHQVGWVRVGVGQRAAGAQLVQIVRDGVLYALGAILIGAVIAAFMGRQLTRKLYAIHSVADAVKAGKVRLRVSVPGNDEPAQLAFQFNEMLDTLEQREQELLASHVALQKSEAQLRNVLAITGEGIWDWNLSTDRIVHNLQWCNLLGLGPDMIEHSSARFAEYLHDDDRDVVMDRVQASLGGDCPYLSEHRMIRSDGTVIWVKDRGEVVERDALGNPLRMLGSMGEITSRKEAEASVTQLNMELERRVLERTAALEATVQELDAFAYSVSHDLRGPLRGIDGFSNLLLEEHGDRLDESGRSHLLRICSGVQRMSTLINDLLRLSHIARAPLHSDRLNLSALAVGLLKRMQEVTPDRQVTTLVTPGIVVEGDPGLLGAALENLLNNAWKYSSKTPNARIEFGRTESNGEPAFFVKDNGAGFDMKYADRLFSAFERLHHLEEFEGSGIGLATVSRIVLRHGGRIWAESEVGLGATFYFTLPCGRFASSGASGFVAPR